jgi:hypothetical protein
MKPATFPYRNIVVTGIQIPVRIPAWATAWSPRLVQGKRIGTANITPDVTIVRGDRPQRLLSHHRLMERIGDLMSRSSRPSMVVIEFAGKPQLREDELVELFGHFNDPMRVGVAWGADQAKSRLEEALAKLSVMEEKPDSLGEVQVIVEATSDLRSDSGRLNASKVAPVFGISESELAKALGVSRQALSKTPDSKRIQGVLLHFDRTARIRAAFRDDAKFRAWLRVPLDSLEKAAPLDLLLKGESEVVGDLAEDMLTGAPS